VPLGSHSQRDWKKGNSVMHAGPRGKWMTLQYYMDAIDCKVLMDDEKQARITLVPFSGCLFKHEILGSPLGAIAEWDAGPERASFPSAHFSNNRRIPWKQASPHFGDAPTRTLQAGPLQLQNKACI
jgi:hypothetical protein